MRSTSRSSTWSWSMTWCPLLAAIVLWRPIGVSAAEAAVGEEAAPRSADPAAAETVTVEQTDSTSADPADLDLDGSPEHAAAASAPEDEIDAAPAAVGDECNDAKEAPTDPQAHLDDAAPEDKGPLYRFRSSQVTFRNILSAINFIPASDLTYNPYYAMALELQPVFWPTETVYLWSDLYVGGEITQSDWTTDRLYFVRDSALGGGTFYTLPIVDITLLADLSISLPTTKESQALTKRFGVGLYTSASRSFAQLAGLSFELKGGGGKDFHEFTTGGAVAGITGSCALTFSSSCESIIIHSGQRNVDWSIFGGLEIGLTPLEWLDLEASAILIEERLYGISPDGRVSFQPLEPTNTRNWVSWDLEAEMSVTDMFSIAIGASGLYAQLRPDGRYRAPFFNRTTRIYIDLNLNIGGAQISSLD